jgi:hypothetical protein
MRLRHFFGTHLIERHLRTTVGRLPSRFSPGQTSTDNDNVVAHAIEIP